MTKNGDDAWMTGDDEERGTVNADGSPSDRRGNFGPLLWWLVGLAVLGLIVASVFVGVSLKNSYDISQQAKGRRASVEVFCGITDSIVEQIQTLLVSGALLRGDSLEGIPPASVKDLLLKAPPKEVAKLYRPGKISRNLNFDSPQDFEQRLISSRVAEQAFAQRIGERVAREAGTKLPKVKRGDTGVNCNLILAAARTQAAK